jgi:hypothetical protein
VSRKIEVVLNLLGTRASATIELPFEPTDEDVIYFVTILKEKMLERFEADAQKFVLEGRIMSEPGKGTAIEEFERRRRVEQLGRDVSHHLEQIRRLHRGQVVITLIVRAIEHPDGRRDTVVTDDPDPLKAVEAFRVAITDDKSRRFEYYKLGIGDPPR